MKTILVIEDEQSIRTNITKILQFKGFQVIDAENGKSGLQMAKAYLPDLIVCDILMPDLDGHEVLSRLRQASETAVIPFIFLTAKTERSDIRKGMALGADDYLTKPFTSQELIEAVESRLKKRIEITQPYLDGLKQAAENLNRAAYSDFLTGLPNRIWLHHQLQEVLSQLHPQHLIAVLHLNLDRLDDITTTMGHSAGDVLLQTIAQRLTDCVSPPNLVARLGGNEFSLLLVGIERLQELVDWSQKVLDLVMQPYRLSEQAVYIQANIGIAYTPKDGIAPEKLIAHAKVAADWCSKQSSDRYQFYSSAMNALETERRWLAAHLRSALEKSEFELYYQPQVNLITGRVIGLEALIRWCHPERGMISPTQFIPIAEEIGLIDAIGSWVLKTACAQAKKFQDLTLLPLPVSINLSAHQLKQKSLSETIFRTLAQTNLAPTLLSIELTETSTMENLEVAIQTLQELKSAGIRIAIDDFGTGYSSLSYLKRLPIDTLKIDRAFIHQISQDEQDTAIATAIIAMAQSLKLKVIAEGVETEEQLAFLRQRGCHAMQGYLYSPPLPAAEVQHLLVEQKCPHWLAKE